MNTPKHPPVGEVLTSEQLDALSVWGGFSERAVAEIRELRRENAALVKRAVEADRAREWTLTELKRVVAERDSARDALADIKRCEYAPEGHGRCVLLAGHEGQHADRHFCGERYRDATDGDYFNCALAPGHAGDHE